MEQDTFTVYENELVSIKCKEIRNKKDQHKIFWERIDDQNEEDNLEIRETKEGRFKIEIHPPCLKILNAEISDSGCYYCHIRYSTSDGQMTAKTEKAHLIIEKSRHIL